MLRVFKSTEGCERRFCGGCGSGKYEQLMCLMYA